MRPEASAQIEVRGVGGKLIAIPAKRRCGQSSFGDAFADRDDAKGGVHRGMPRNGELRCFEPPAVAGGNLAGSSDYQELIPSRISSGHRQH